MSDNFVIDFDSSQPVTRQKVRIDSQVYELVTPDDLSPAEILWLTEVSQKMSRMFVQTGDGVSGEIAELIDAATKKLIPDLPKAAIKKLPAIKKFRAISLFSEAVEREINGAVPRQASASSSPNSNASTEGPQGTG